MKHAVNDHHHDTTFEFDFVGILQKAFFYLGPDQNSA